MKVTVHDVAKRAGVSSATVDRVLNGRKGVRALTVERVQNAALELGYVPNRLASRLAKGKKYQIGFILPQGPNYFMKKLAHAVEIRKEAMAAENIILDVVFLDIWDSRAPEKLLDIAHGYDALAVVAADDAKVNYVINQLSEHMPIITLVSDAPASHRAAYVGIDNMAAGRTAASLIGRFLPKDNPAKVAIIMGSAALRDHAERKAGFEQVIHHEYPYLKILSPVYGYDDFEKVYQYLDELFREHADIDAIYSLGAGNRGLVRLLEERQNKKKIQVVAHEVTEVSRKALIAGYFDVVLSQNVESEIQQSIEILLNILENRISKNLIKPNIQIFLRDNLPL
ncbi:MAG: substrate-binding domain-containing protein [Alphaproteobacteria bacterium]